MHLIYPILVAGLIFGANYLFVVKPDHESRTEDIGRQEATNAIDWLQSAIVNCAQYGLSSEQLAEARDHRNQARTFYAHGKLGSQ